MFLIFRSCSTLFLCFSVLSKQIFSLSNPVIFNIHSNAFKTWCAFISLTLPPCSSFQDCLVEHSQGNLQPKQFAKTGQGKITHTEEGNQVELGLHYLFYQWGLFLQFLFFVFTPFPSICENPLAEGFTLQNFMQGANCLMGGELWIL